MAGGMQKKMGFGVVLVACLVALFQVSWAAKSHTVGNSTGWTNSAPPTFYPTWAASQTFAVGDSLVFNFATGGHTVAEVSKSDYDSCTTTSPISTATTGPATIKITTAGSHYYICTIPGHCNAGQKLTVTTTTSSTAAPTPSSSRASRRSSPPPSGAATSPASSAAPGPSSSGASTSSPSPSGGAAASPSSSTTPSAAGGSSTSTIAPPPSSANVAGAGLVLPFILVAAALLF